MTIFELSKLTTIDNAKFINFAPFVFVAYPSTWATGSYWTSAFGAPAESASATISVSSFARDSTTIYSKMDSLADCIATEQSFYWDGANQALYVHLEHDQDISYPSFQYSSVFGFCDKKACYIGGIFYAPVLTESPALAQTQDLEAYDELAFLSGDVKLSNVGGYLDAILDESWFGFDCFIGYLEDEKDVDDYSHDEVVPLAALYVEDFAASQKEITLHVQDRRKAGNIKIPTELFAEADYPNAEDSVLDTPIPMILGAVNIVPAICTNGEMTSGNVNFRVAQVLTSLGTVQVKKADVWTTVAPSSSDLATGSFVLASASGRDSSGNPYDCRVVGAVGVAITHASDAIKYLNERYLDVEYLASNYDRDEWEAEEAALSTIGIYVADQTELYEIIRQIQAGANVGFRYEFKPNGKRTIRICDYDREDTTRICAEDIADILDIPFSTDSDLLAASVKINYARDYVEDECLSVVDDSEAETVRDAYRQQPQLEFDTLLPTKVLATTRALADETKYSVIRKTLSGIEVYGKEFLGLRIFDTLIIEATPGFVDADCETVVSGREWLGIWKAIVVGINPDTNALKNSIDIVLLEEVEGAATLYVLADYDGRYIGANTEDNYFVGVS